MHSFQLVSALATLASFVQANNVMTFQSLDDLDRTVYFTPNAGKRWIGSVEVGAGQSVDVNIDDGWVGNAYAVQAGKPNKPGMLAEVNFESPGSTWFDVSAIVDPTDVDNISEMYPGDDPNKPISGCGFPGFPCNNAYYQPDDVQTKFTNQPHIIVTMGKNGHNAQKRDVDYEEFENFPRSNVVGRKQ